MKVEVTCKAYLDIPIYKLDFYNSDTPEDYKEELIAEIGNTALDKIWNGPLDKICEELEIVSVTPYDEGIDEVNNIINDWKKHYDNRPKEYKLKNIKRYEPLDKES